MHTAKNSSRLGDRLQRWEISLRHEITRSPRIEFLLKSTLITLVAFCANFVIMAHRSPLREPIRTLEYSFLQKSLRFAHSVTTGFADDSNPRPDKPPVIIDISSYAGDSDDCSTMPSKGITAIHCLARVVKEVQHYNPSAIGIDIDLSPGEDGWPIESDTWFYLDLWKRSAYDPQCRPIAGNTQIKLGVFRWLYDSHPNKWLGPEFSCMAAGILVPLDNEMNFYSYTPKKPGSGPDNRLLMASALFEATGGKIRRDRWLPVLTDMDDPSMNQDWRYSAYVVDYSYLKEVNERVYQWKGTSLEVLKERIEGSVVLIGDVNGPHDGFPTPVGSVAGVVIHACSLMTLRTNPLGFVDGTLSTAFDLLLAGLSMLLVMIGSVVVRKKHVNYHRYHLVERRYRMAISGMLSFVCLFAAGWTHIFWPDYFWVAPVLFLDTYVSDPFWKLALRVRAGIWGWFTKGYEYGVE